MTLHVRLFARARDLAGTATLTLELPPGATVAELRRGVRQACPALASLVPHCLIAVANDFAADDRVLAPDLEIALLPPVSGG